MSQQARQLLDFFPAGEEPLSLPDFIHEAKVMGNVGWHEFAYVGLELVRLHINRAEHENLVRSVGLDDLGNHLP